MTLSILPVRVTDLAPQSDVVCLLSFKTGNEAMGASSGKAPFTELLGLSPAFDVCPEEIDLSLGCDNIIFKLPIIADFGEVDPVVQFPNGFPESVVVGSIPSEHAAEPAGHRLIGISAVVGGAEVHFRNGGRICWALDLAVPSHPAIFCKFDPFCWVGEAIGAWNGDSEGGEVVVVFDIALWSCFMCIGKELDLFLQVFKGGLEVCRVLLMTVLSGPDSGDEALGHGSEDSCIKIWAPSKDASGRIWGEWWL